MFLSFLSRFVLIFLPVFFLHPVISRSQSTLQYSTKAEEEFTSGLSFYKRGNFKSAAEEFNKLVRSVPLNQRTTAAYLMKAKAELYADNAAEAEKTLQSFLISYPASSYVPDAEYTLGLLYIKNGAPEKAVSSLLNALRSVRTTSSGLKESTVLLLLDKTIDRSVDASTLEQLVVRSKNLTEEEYLRIKLGEKQVAFGDYAAAKSTLDLLSKKFTKPAFTEKISMLEARLSKPRPLKIGVLLPLMRKGPSGRERETGTGILEGIEFALEEHLKDKPSNISLEIRDTGNDQATTLAVARELAEDPSVFVILGPAFSGEAMTASLIANEKSVPIITPTANANGIATKGQYMFQANPDMDTRARAMAQHAVKNLRFKRIAVLSTDDPVYKSLADEFTKEVKRLGGDIVGSEVYEKRSANLTNQLASLRKKAVAISNQPFITFSYKITMIEIGKLSKLGVPIKVLDTLLNAHSTVNATDLLGEYAKSKLQANGIPFTIGDPRLDSLQRIATAIDGIYCPISSPLEIGIISAQLIYTGLMPKILGSGEWNSAAELNANKRSTEGVQFEADSWLDTRNPAYVDFTSRYLKRYFRMPVKNNVYGYDIANMVLSLVEQGATTRVEMKNALGRVTSFEGLHSKISFSPRHTNSWLNILEYSNEMIQRVNEVKVE